MVIRLFAAFCWFMFTFLNCLKAQQILKYSDNTLESFRAFDSSIYYIQVKTFLNPALGSDHPDPTVLKDGTDFYMYGPPFISTLIYLFYIQLILFTGRK